MKPTNKGTLYYTVIHLSQKIKKTNNVPILIDDYPEEKMTLSQYISNLSFLRGEILHSTNNHVDILNFCTISPKLSKQEKIVSYYKEEGKKRSLTEEESREYRRAIEDICDDIADQHNGTKHPTIEMDEDGVYIYDKKTPGTTISFTGKIVKNVVKYLYEHIENPVSYEKLRDYLIENEFVKKNYSTDSLRRAIHDSIIKRFKRHTYLLPFEIVKIDRGVMLTRKGKEMKNLKRK